MAGNEKGRPKYFFIVTSTQSSKVALSRVRLSITHLHKSVEIGTIAYVYIRLALKLWNVSQRKRWRFHQTKQSF